jgi:hypothetical protein
MITKLEEGFRYAKGALQFKVLKVNGDTVIVELHDGAISEQQSGALLFMGEPAISKRMPCLRLTPGTKSGQTCCQR